MQLRESTCARRSGRPTPFDATVEAIEPAARQMSDMVDERTFPKRVRLASGNREGVDRTLEVMTYNTARDQTRAALSGVGGSGTGRR